MRRKHERAAVQYTLRNVPPAVDRALRARAKRLDKSLNEVALDALARGAGVESMPEPSHDLDFLFGSWVDDPTVDAALAEQRAVDAALWQ